MIQMVALSETTELIETHDVLTKKDLVEKQVEPIVDVSHDATTQLLARQTHMSTSCRQTLDRFFSSHDEKEANSERRRGGGVGWDYLMALFHLLGPLPRLCEANPAWRNKIFIFSCTIATYWGAL